MIPRISLVCSLLFVSATIFVAWNTQESPQPEPTTGFTPSDGKNDDSPVGTKPQASKDVSSLELGSVPKLLAAAGDLGEGALLTLPNPIGPDILAVIDKIEQEDREVFEVAGRLQAPREGWFFLRRQRAEGQAGDFVGLIDLVDEGRVLEWTEAGLVSRLREEVVCVGLPPLELERLREIEVAGDGHVPGAFLASVLPGIDVHEIPIPDYQKGIVPLESLRGATAVAYLDYNGESVSSWGGIEAEGYSMTPNEMLEVWERVSEDFAPFSINVTTDEAVYLAAPPTSRIRCIVTPTNDASPGSGGVAYLNSFNWDGDTPCWAFYRTGKSAAEVISHEIGHTLGLNHDGIAEPDKTAVGYYSGHGSGQTAWAPIMGVGYYSNLSQWSKGEYAYANNTQDDLLIITTQNNDVAYRPDDHGNTLGAASPLEIYDDSTVLSRGILEQGTDIDGFSFSTFGGSLTLEVEPLEDGPNVDLKLDVVDATGASVLSDQPEASLKSAVTGTLAAGEYAVLISPAGKGTATTGYTTYGSLGHFEITGTIANAVLPTRLSLDEDASNGTSVGNVLVSNPNGAPLTYTVVTGNEDNVFAISNAGQVTLADNSLLDFESRPIWNLVVNVTNSQNAAYNVTGHRVVVSLNDINEAPIFNTAAPLVTLLEYTKLGTMIHRAQASDVDLYTTLTYTIVSGNTGEVFAMDPSTGVITVNGPLDRNVATGYTLGLQVMDNAAPALTATQSLQIEIETTPSGLVPGTIPHTLWTGISGSDLIDLTSASDYPNNPAIERERTSFEAPTDTADNFGAAMRGYLIPPADGDYIFWISSDDEGELLLSSDNDPSNASRIAHVPGWTYEREWNYYKSQESYAVTLNAGQAYYIEARMKEGSGGDNLSVAWERPGGSQEIIPGLYLAPFYQNYTPTFDDATLQVYEHAIPGVAVGTVSGNDRNTNESLSYTIVSGNESGIFTLEPATGTLRVADGIALSAAAMVPQVLTVRASDNGSPIKHADATVTVELIAEGSIQTSALVQEIWDDLSGSSLEALTSNARYPRRSDRVLEHSSGFDTGKNLGNDYGSRMRAYLTPTESGNYTFSMTSDDQSELWLGTTAAPSSAVKIASISGWSGYDQWTKFGTQTSASISLTVGTPYYIETRHKEGGGGDHVRVAWIGGSMATRTVIGSDNLTPYDINEAPSVGNTLGVVSPTAGSVVGSIMVNDSLTDSMTFALLPGRDAQRFELDPTTGALTLLDEKPLLALGALEIDVLVQDDGMGGLFSPRTTQETVRVILEENPSIASAQMTSGLVNATQELGAVATQTTTDLNGDAARAIDGSVANTFSSGSVTHSAALQPNEAWQVTFPTPCQIHEICLYNRGETLGFRLSNFEVCVYLEGQLVWAQAYHTEGTHVPDAGLFSLSGFQWLRGDAVEVRLLGDEPRFLSLAEVEVYGTAAPTGSGIAYERWAAQLHALDPKAEGTLTDTDSDGMQNLYEFAVNADPNASEQDAGIESETVQEGESEWVEVQFRRRRDHTDIGLDYAVEFNEGLTELEWSSALAMSEGEVVPNADGVTETVTVRCQLPLSNTRQRLFARLMVTN